MHCNASRNSNVMQSRLTFPELCAQLYYKDVEMRTMEWAWKMRSLLTFSFVFDFNNFRHVY